MLTQYVAPILAAGSPAALMFVALRFGALDAVLRLLAGAVAVLARKERGERALEVLRIMHGKEARETTRQRR